MQYKVYSSYVDVTVRIWPCDGAHEAITKGLAGQLDILSTWEAIAEGE